MPSYLACPYIVLWEGNELCQAPRKALPTQMALKYVSTLSLFPGRGRTGNSMSPSSWTAASLADKPLQLCFTMAATFRFHNLVRTWGPLILRWFLAFLSYERWHLRRLNFFFFQDFIKIRGYDQDLAKSVMRKLHIFTFPFLIRAISSYLTLMCRKCFSGARMFVL